MVKSLAGGIKHPAIYLLVAQWDITNQPLNPNDARPGEIEQQSVSASCLCGTSIAISISMGGAIQLTAGQLMTRINPAKMDVRGQRRRNRWALHRKSRKANGKEPNVSKRKCELCLCHVGDTRRASTHITE